MYNLCYVWIIMDVCRLDLLPTHSSAPILKTPYYSTGLGYLRLKIEAIVFRKQEMGLGRRFFSILLLGLCAYAFVQPGESRTSISYESLKESLGKCGCFHRFLKEARIESPTGLDVLSIHRLVDDLIGEYEISAHMTKLASDAKKKRVGFAWDASATASEPPPEVSIADMNLDDTRKFVKDYDLDVSVTLENGESKEDVIQNIERAAQKARQERLDSHVGFVRDEDGVVEIKYIIIGAGPGGLQQAYFLEKHSRDYIVFEKKSRAGSFFSTFPRSRRLSSINRRVVGRSIDGKEASMRFDGNSLLSNDQQLKFSKYSASQFPHASVYQQYLNDYSKKLNLKIQYNSNVVSIKRQRRPWRGDSNSNSPKNLFLVTLDTGAIFRCRVLLVATGLELIRTVPNVDLTDDYASVSLDPRTYLKRRLLFLGTESGEFEAEASTIMQAASQYSSQVSFFEQRGGRIFGTKNRVVGGGLSTRGSIQETYFDNNIFTQVNVHGEANLNRSILLNSSKTTHGTINVGWRYSKKVGVEDVKNGVGDVKNITGLLGEFDDVILCPSFGMNTEMFASNRTIPILRKDLKYPKLNYNYASQNVSHMYFTGILMNSGSSGETERGDQYNSKKRNRAASSKIGGWRYLSRALHNYLEVRYEQRTWPGLRKVPSHAAGITDRVRYRIRQSGGLFNMPGFNGLKDLITFPLSGYFVNDIRRSESLFLHEVPGLPDSASDILLRVKKFHNSDMVLVRHFLTLKFSHNFCQFSKDSKWTGITGFHPVVQLYSLPLNETSKLIVRGKSQLLREYHFAPDEKFQWADDTLHGDTFQKWIERVVLRIISGGHLVPPHVPRFNLEKNECPVIVKH